MHYNVPQPLVVQVNFKRIFQGGMMVTRRLITAVVVAAPRLVGVSAIAQTTGTITGTATTAGAALPGATVTISSPALQGVRTTVSGANGDYVFPALPPGKYSVTAELEGRQK